MKLSPSPWFLVAKVSLYVKKYTNKDTFLYIRNFVASERRKGCIAGLAASCMEGLQPPEQGSSGAKNGWTMDGKSGSGMVKPRTCGWRRGKHKNFTKYCNNRAQ